MPARILSIPFVLVAIVLLYLSWEESEVYAYWIPGPVITVAVIYVLGPQINWWWYVRHTPDLRPVYRRLLLERHPYYSRLSLADRQRFRQRVFLLRLAQDFMAQGWERVPEDVQTVLAIQAATLTLGWKDFLLGPYEKVVVYPHPFPSPQYPDHLHHSELYEEDAVLLFDARRVMQDFAGGQKGFSCALYEYARVIVRVHRAYPWPDTDPVGWEGLQGRFGYGRAFVAQQVGLPEEELELLPVCLVAYVVFASRFAEAFPEVFRELAEVLRFDPQTARRQALAGPAA